MSAPRLTTPRNRVAGDMIGDTWALIRTGVEKNLTTPMGQKPMEMKEYMECYTAVHVFCTHQKAAPSTTSFGSSDHKGGAHLLGEVLYAYLKEYLFEYVQNMRARLEKFKGEELLKMYVEEWKHFRDGAQKNARLLMYLNRHWVLRVLDEGNHEKVYEILPLHTMLWEEVVLDVSQDVVREEILRIIERWRDGEVVDEELVRGVVEASPIDENDPTKRVPDVYQLLLQATADSSIDTKAEAILFRALRLGYAPTISYLLNQGLKADIEDATGRTPLSHASQTHSTELITLLLSYDASLNAQDKEGLAPLHWACIVSPRPHYGNDYIEAVKLLLERGADPMLKDNSGKKPLAWAKKAGKARAVDLLKKAMEGKGVSQEDI